MRINQSSWIEPRFLLRGIMGVLLAANLVAVVIAFKPFGGSADDLQREEAALNQQLSGLRDHVAKGKQLVAKLQNARKEPTSSWPNTSPTSSAALPPCWTN